MADEDKSEPERPNQIGIYYQRSRHYRTIQADGAQIGVTPRGKIQFTLFSDQKPMPEFVMHQITSEGQLGNPIEEVVKQGAIREVEINVIMDVEAIKSFMAVLGTTLDKVATLQMREVASGSEDQESAK
jgi:hypothetical protein